MGNIVSTFYSCEHFQVSSGVYWLRSHRKHHRNHPSSQYQDHPKMERLEGQETLCSVCCFLYIIPYVVDLHLIRVALKFNLSGVFVLRNMKRLSADVWESIRVTILLYIGSMQNIRGSRLMIHQFVFGWFVHIRNGLIIASSHLLLQRFSPYLRRWEADREGGQRSDFFLSIERKCHSSTCSRSVIAYIISSSKFALCIV